MFTSSDADILTASLGAIVYQAGRKILSVYAHDFSSELKQDNTPITLADRQSHESISSGLASLSAPGFGVLPVLSEEGNTIPFEKRSAWSSYWLVDPLDGTKEFIKRNGEFTVNIALVSAGAAVCGAVYIPVTDILYTGFTGYGAFRIDSLGSRLDNPQAQGRRLPLSGREKEPGQLTAAISRSHLNPETEGFMRHLKQQGLSVTTISAGSSLKFCNVAEGSADIYPRFGPTMEWDTAAAHAVCTAASCSVVSIPEQEELTYNKEDLRNPWFVVYRNPGLKKYFTYFDVLRRPGQ